MASKYQHLFPTSFELIGLLFVTVMLAIIGNSKTLLNYYGLNQTNAVIRDGAGGAISKGLGQLDTLSFTNQVVTFLIWAVIGLVCFSVAQAIVSAYHEFKLEEDLSSNRYIHPSTFTRRAFWRQVAGNFAVMVVGFMLLAGSIYAFLGYILPIGLTYTQVFLQGVSLVHAGYFLLGLAVMYVGLIVLDICFRILTQRRRLLA